MANSGRKRKKADKAKVHLKKGGGKKSLRLPKGLNVTDSRVTTRKILLVNQLGGETSSSDGPVTKKNIGMKDLLSKLNSLSSSIRVDGLEGLMELIKSDNQTILEDHLSILLQRLSPLATDRESKIRKLTNTVLSLILKQVDISQAEPLFPILSAHLCCGLSHIDTYIQRDSLKLLDELIHFLPALILQNFNQILPNCLNQISTQKSSQTARSLTPNVNEKISALQWRKEVLQRVEKLLQIVVDNNSPDVIDNFTHSNFAKSVDDFYMGICEDIHAGNNLLTMSELQTVYDKRSFLATAKPQDGKNGSENGFAQNLVPLLLDTWSEALLSAATEKNSKMKSSTAGPGLISPEIVPILETCVKTLHLLIQHFKLTVSEFDEFSKMGAFRSEYEPKILKQLVENFPYDLLYRTSDKKSDNGDICPTNLTIIELFLDLSSNKPNANLMSKFIGYIKGIVQYKNTNPDVVNQLSAILREVFKLGLPDECAEEFDKLVSILLEKYSNNSKLVELLGMLALQEEFKFESSEKWVEKVAQALVQKTATLKQRHFAKYLFKQRDETLIRCLPENFDYFDIIANN